LTGKGIVPSAARAASATVAKERDGGGIFFVRGRARREFTSAGAQTRSSRATKRALLRTL
jgi:hypothetical protein